MAEEEQYTFGMIGLGTMGCNLLLNMADHGFAVAGYDKDAKKVAVLEEEKEVKAVSRGKGSHLYSYSLFICNWRS